MSKSDSSRKKASTKKTAPLKKSAPAKKKKAVAVKKSKFALVIGTYAAVPYIHLHLESRKRHYPSVPLLIHDDSSHKSERLKELCNEYGADFISTPTRSAPTVGDLSAFLNGLKWAKKNGNKILVKMSRRFIPVSDWTQELDELEKTGHHTFCNITRSFNFGFRTECTGLRISDWEKTVEKLEDTVSKNQGVFVEGFVHNIARELNESNPDAKKWDEENNRPPEANGYAVWKFMGDDRCTQYPGFLWYNSFAADAYKKLSDEYGLDYRLEDFLDPNEGGGNQ